MAGEWRLLTSEEFCTSVRDGTHDSPEPVEHGRCLVTSRHITGGRLDMSNAYMISQEDFAAINRRSKVDRWDVLISMIGTVGEPCLIRDEPDFAIKNIGLFKSKGEVEGKWLYYYLQSAVAQQVIREQARGTTQQYIPLGALRELFIPVPGDFDEMRAITNMLGTLDDKIELNRKMNETLEAMVRALFKSWFVDFDPVRAKADGRDPGLPKHIAAFFPDSFEDSEMGEAPAGWLVVTLDQLASIQGGKQLSAEEYHQVGTFPVFGANGIMGYSERATHSGFVIAFGRVGAYCGSIHWAYHDAWINNNASSVVPFRWPEYILQAMLDIDFESMRTGSAQPFIPNNALAAAQTLRPPDDILDAFCSIVHPLRIKQTALEQESHTLAALRDTLLPKLISGEIRVKDSERVIQSPGCQMDGK